MAKESSESLQIRKIFEILKSIEGKQLTTKEKQNLTIEVAEYLLNDAKKNLTRIEKKQKKIISKMIRNSNIKGFFILIFDQCLRTKKSLRVADQITYLLQQLDIPTFLTLLQRLGLSLFKYLSPKITQFIVPYFISTLRKETAHIILPGEEEYLLEHLKKRETEKVRLNINHIKEAVLGETEAKKRLQLYLDNLKDSTIDYISIKISSIFSQINSLSFDDTIEILAKKLRKLYRHAMDHPRKLLDDSEESKFVSLDMEEYKDLNLTVTLFIKVLSEPEFHNLSAGIALQAYIPESLEIQKNLTNWAKDRIKNGGSPIKIRIVKGANLLNEQVESSIKNLKLPIYTSKVKVDASFKEMISYGMILENAKAVRIGIATHNLFDIAFAIITMFENHVLQYVDFEVLEGMANNIRRTIQKITPNIIAYCPVAKKADFPYALAYLIRRLDENTANENFLKYFFNLKLESDEWDFQINKFLESIQLITKISHSPRRTQDRNTPTLPENINTAFENEAESDFSLLQNIEFAKQTILEFQNYKPNTIPCVINGEIISIGNKEPAYNPSYPEKIYYSYILAKKEQLEKCLSCAEAFFQTWRNTPSNELFKIFYQIAKLLREKRKELLGVMMMDTGKTIMEADLEINEAIDYVDYYIKQYHLLQNTKGLKYEPKGIVLVASPWNFPCAIPLGGIISALLTGNCVIFKPAPEAVLVGWNLVNILWDSGIPKKALQFININEDIEGSYLIKDKRLNKVILTGATSTAEKFLKIRNDLDLSAETGGKNAMIITNMSDKDLAIKDLIVSAFSHSGQKCSAVSLAIIEKDLYDDAFFMNQLKDAAQSLITGVPTDLKTFIVPLIKTPSEDLKKAFTTLDKKESWLLEPKQDSKNPNLWTPGIKLGIEPGSFMHTNELFGPVLSLLRAKDLSHAIEIANSTKYALTSGLHSLDPREQLIWRNEIVAGNCYINRTTTGAIVQRQPFGGWKKSSFGSGYKTGGPNYLYNFMKIYQDGLPKEKHPINKNVNNLSQFIEMLDLSAEELGIWYVSISNYAYWWKKMKTDKDSVKLVGQDNFLKYIPMNKVTLRLVSQYNEFDLMRILAAALTCGCNLEISFDKDNTNFNRINLFELSSLFQIVNESEDVFIKRLKAEKINRCRFLEKPSNEIYEAAAQAGCYIATQTVIANGNIELLHYVKELSTSINYHRYGNLGIRENELRKHIL
jgi:RHH-type transcriptional regulator, proline utilization regulon repressor / proline dehydrogenase / delta 1-pyrroline-5-carboxylate dehydrogenase